MNLRKCLPKFQCHIFLHNQEILKTYRMFPVNVLTENVSEMAVRIFRAQKKEGLTKNYMPNSDSEYRKVFWWTTSSQ